MKLLLTCFLSLMGSLLIAQTHTIDERLTKSLTEKEMMIIEDFKLFLDNVFQDKSIETDLKPDLQALTQSALNNVKQVMQKTTEGKNESILLEILNFYKAGKDVHRADIAISDKESNKLHFILNLMIHSGDKTLYAIPLNHLTADWKQRIIGNTTYYYRDEINESRAETFDEKQKFVANQFGLQAESFHFYMTKNYQEFLQLIGLSYERETAGQLRDGYGIDGGYIFAIDNNEDFSHDVFHYYSGQIHDPSQRNWVTEEGLAYLWGNAYYTDPEGGMIGMKRLIPALHKFLQSETDKTPLQLLEENVRNFTPLAKEASTRSTISALICQEVFKQKGMDGLNTLIACGRKNRVEAYLIAIDELIGMNRENFNQRFEAILLKYIQ